MTDARLALADRALADAAVHLASRAPGGATEEREGLVLFAGAHRYPGPYCNGMVRLDRAMAAPEAIALAQAFFTPRRRGFVVWARSGVDDDLVRCSRERGWFERPPAQGMPLMVCDANPEGGHDERALETITTPEQADHYLGVVADAYGMSQAPPPLLQALFFTPGAVLADGAIAVLLEDGGRPAAGAMAVIRDQLACVLWAATSPWARGRGLGPTCMRAITRAAFDRGAGLVVAQSSQIGLAHWTRLGFELIGTYRRFLATLTP